MSEAGGTVATMTSTAPGHVALSWEHVMEAPTEEELRVAVQCRTHFEAVHGLLVGRGLRVWIGTSGDDPDDDPDGTRALLIPYPYPGSEEYAGWGTRRLGTENDWRPRPPEDPFAHSRNQLMVDAVEALRIQPSPNTAVRVFTGDHDEIDAHEGARAIRAAIVRAWWETRLAEGHTPESARTLLRLMVDPVAWATYDALVDALLDAGDEALDADRQRRAGQT